MDDQGKLGPATTTPDFGAMSEDRTAISDYFASQRFRQYRTLDPGSTTPEFWEEPHSIFNAPGMPSLLSGPVGLAAITLMFAVLFPIGLKLLQEFMPNRPAYTSMMLIVQTLMLPPLIAFGFAAVTPMFWYGSVVVRFAMALASTVPACIGFSVALKVLEANNPSDFWIGFSVVMFTSLLATAATAVAVQMWSPWTMSHHRVDNRALPRMGTRSMIELTAIAAAGCAVFVTVDVGDYFEGILLFGAIGLISAITIAAALIVYFHAGTQPRTMLIIGLAGAFAAAFVLNAFFAAQEYGWDVLTMEILLIGGVSLYGAIVNVAVMWLCLRWLRFCGWRCIHRRTASVVTSQTAAQGP